MHDFSSVGIEAKHGQLLAVRRGGGEPDLFSPNDRRGPAAAGDGCLPFYIFCLAPCQRQLAEYMAVALRASKLIPVRSREGDGAQ